MKKKGLIISTVVMVVVLIASLTTATYAWFTASTSTKIDAFDVSVVAGNAINVGVKEDNKHKVGAVNDDFLSGTVKWTNQTAGTIGETAGRWSEGVRGLTPTLNHQIKWGAQSKSVGAINGATNSLSTTINDYGFIGSGTFNSTAATGKANSTLTDESTFLNATTLKTSGASLETPTAAYANVTPAAAEGGDDTNGDYVYLFLGASPTKNLKTNSLYLVLDGTTSTGTNVGILSAVHVAYRITKSCADSVTTQWTEKEFFEGATYASTLVQQTIAWSDAEKTAYNTAVGSAAPSTKASVIKIVDLSTTQGAIDQIEIIIYIAGPDADNNDSGKNAGGKMQIFFYTEDVEG